MALDKNKVDHLKFPEAMSPKKSGARSNRYMERLSSRQSEKVPNIEQEEDENGINSDDIQLEFEHRLSQLSQDQKRQDENEGLDEEE